ncbi:MAG: iron-sulfur cluster assembly scaffold protein [Sulfurimonas sp.]|jgi:nitrogen fixation NifU-like protein|nr:iron-sulfur cluster assembly scaffold protein [Sulfurimonas sp.]
MFEDVILPKELNPETLEHLMSPQNYGNLDNANCIGVGLDEKTKEYVIFYTLLGAELIKDVKFATNGCQDTVVIGSMFTQMIKGNDLEYANSAIQKMNKKLVEMTEQQKACADIVFTAFLASMKNFENIQNGAEEELHILKMKNSCEAENMKGDSNE